MLERAAGCLESGSLRRLLSGPRKPLKSRRMLHSAFWNHGAGELELSLWATLVRAAEAAGERNDHSSSAPNSTQQRLFLDFLYPSGVFKFIRKYSTWNADLKASRPVKARFSKSAQRLYTSATSERLLPYEAELMDDSVIEDTEEIFDENVGKEKVESCSPNPIETLQINEYDKAWREHILNDYETQRKSAPKLLSYLATSDRIVDAHRYIETFEMMDANENKDRFRELIKAHIHVGNSAEAIKAHTQALAAFKEPVGSELLLAHLIQECHWQPALYAWVAVSDMSRNSLEYDLWKVRDSLPCLPEKALQLGKFVKENFGEAASSIPADIKDFATAVVVRALLPNQNELITDRKTFHSLIGILQSWGVDNDDFYERCIFRLIAADQTDLAIYSYRKYRKTVAGAISRNLLQGVLKIACKSRGKLAIKNVLEDCHRFYGGASREAYRLIASYFAAEGEVDVVKALNEQYFADKQSVTADDLAPIFNVHARRRELSKVVELFETMEAKYGAKPNIRIWNILLNAYGRVSDVDGAFQRFHQLLDSSLIPDDYTFGTMMGICVSSGDLDQALELFRLSKTMKVHPSCAMIDCIVLGHVQEGRLRLAEKICEAAFSMSLKGSMTRMWNYLLIAHAMRRDLESANRIVLRMEEKNVKFDAQTYSALMQALCIVGQAYAAEAILKDVMPEAGVPATEFHYAIVMGGYLNTGELTKVFSLYQSMKKNGIEDSVSTRMMLIKAAAREDRRSLGDSSEARLEKAEKYFQKAYTSLERPEVGRLRKGVGPQAAYESAYFEYMIFAYSGRSIERVKELYDQYLATVPAEHRTELPIKMLSALMASNLAVHNYQGVQQCWNLAFQRAKRDSQPISGKGFLKSRRYLLSAALLFQMQSLSSQGKSLVKLIDEVTAAGFALTNKNWNIFIQLLAKTSRHKKAFHLCESILMPNWTGWATDRRRAPIRNRLPIELRNAKKEPGHLRPIYHTLLFLSKAYSELQSKAAESRRGETILSEIARDCPKTLEAVKSMPRLGSDLERRILRG